jgi:hypothetical protein
MWVGDEEERGKMEKNEETKEEETKNNRED